MVKTYKITFEVNMDASHIETFVVKANTERKAIILAKTKALNKGVRFTKLISAKNITPQPADSIDSLRAELDKERRVHNSIKERNKAFANAVNPTQK